MSTNSAFLAPGEGETVFSVSSTPIKFGPGALREVGEEARALGMKRVALFVDPHVLASAPGETAIASLRAAGLDVEVYGQARCEPNSDSFEAAALFAREGAFDGFVSLGGGSVMDTAKAANLLSTYPDELIAYINAPIGRAKPIPGPPEAAHRLPDHLRHRQRDDRHHDRRPEIRRPEDGHRLALAEALAGAHRSNDHRDAARRRRRGDRLRCAHPCRRVVYGAALYQPAAAGPSVAATAVPGFDAVQRHRRHRRHPPGRQVPRSRRARRERHRGAPPADVRFDAGRSGLRQRRRAHPARHVLLGGHAQARVHGRRLPGARGHGSARHRGRDQRPGRLPLHRVGQSGSASGGGCRPGDRHCRRGARRRGRASSPRPSSR